MDRGEGVSIIGNLPAISQSRWLRFVFVFVAYVGQGLPVGLFFYAIPTWLAANGVSAVLIGSFVGATALPWTLKFVNGFIMDRFTFLAMGKRRAWLIGAQIVMIAGFLVGAMLNPGFGDIAVLTAVSFSINAATTFQDVAIDGLAVDLVPDDERPRANGLMFGGQAVGIAAGSALSGLLLASFGVAAAFLCIGAIVFGSLALAMAARERPGERFLPWTTGQASTEAKAQKADAWLPLLRSVWGAMLNRKSIMLSIAMMMNGVIYGFYLTVGPVIATGVGGWSDQGFSSITGIASLAAGLAGVFVFGFLVNRIGTRFGGTTGLLLYSSLGLTMIVLQPYWTLTWIIAAFAFGTFLTDIYLKVSTCSTAMRLCDVKVAATQFTLYMALANAGTTLSGFLTGPLESVGGNTALLFGIVVAGLIGAAAFATIPAKGSESAQLSPSID